MSRNSIWWKYKILKKNSQFEFSRLKIPKSFCNVLIKIFFRLKSMLENSKFQKFLDLIKINKLSPLEFLDKKSTFNIMCKLYRQFRFNITDFSTYRSSWRVTGQIPIPWLFRCRIRNPRVAGPRGWPTWCRPCIRMQPLLLIPKPSLTDLIR